MEPVISAYKKAHKRLFLMDYDGVLAELKPTPSEAKPTPELLAILSRLAQDARNTVVIISGRRHQELEEWLGNLPISFAAEHGLLVKEYGRPWSLTNDIDTAWKPSVLAVMQPYAAKVAGSLIEDKTNALVWHYRNARNQDDAKATEKQLAAELQPLGEQFDLRIMLGSKIVEVQPLGTNKGLAANYWLERGNWDFILAAGDDTTDEDMFKAMPPEAFTIKVRPGDTSARLRIATPDDMLALLNSL
jgi:trehalose 6-phosphate synthase/phosphatase